MDILDFTMNTEDPDLPGKFHPCMEIAANLIGGVALVFLSTGGVAGFSSNAVKAVLLRGDR
jgi:hypothetical protein